MSSITTYLFHSETKQYTTQYWFIVWKYVLLLHVLNKNEYIINARYWAFWKSQKFVPAKHKKSAIRQNKLPQKG